MGEVIRGMTEPHTRCYVLYTFPFNPLGSLFYFRANLIFVPGSLAEGLGVNAREPGTPFGNKTLKHCSIRQ